jgi:hypothetical protein
MSLIIDWLAEDRASSFTSKATVGVEAGGLLVAHAGPVRGLCEGPGLWLPGAMVSSRVTGNTGPGVREASSTGER